MLGQGRTLLGAAVTILLCTLGLAVTNAAGPSSSQAARASTRAAEAFPAVSGPVGAVEPFTEPLEPATVIEDPVPTTVPPPPPPPPPPPAPAPEPRPVVATSTDDPAANRALGQRMAAEHGWTGAEWDCLDHLWGAHESGWRATADNPHSEAYGIPQALPGSKMGPGWEWDPVVQIGWGLGYIGGRYGSPCGAEAAWHRQGWY